MRSLSLGIGLVARFNLHGGGGGWAVPQRLPLEQKRERELEGEGERAKALGKMQYRKGLMCLDGGVEGEELPDTRRSGVLHHK